MKHTWFTRITQHTLLIIRRKIELDSKRKEDRRITAGRRKDEAGKNNNNSNINNSAVATTVRTSITSETFSSDSSDHRTQQSERPRSVNFESSVHRNENSFSNNKNGGGEGPTGKGRDHNRRLDEERMRRLEEERKKRIEEERRKSFATASADKSSPGTDEDRRREEELAIQKILEQQGRAQILIFGVIHNSLRLYLRIYKVKGIISVYIYQELIDLQGGVLF